jgi:hypothetical protein
VSKQTPPRFVAFAESGSFAALRMAIYIWLPKRIEEFSITATTTVDGAA